MRPGTVLDPSPSRYRKPSDPLDRPNPASTTFFLTRDPEARNVSTTSKLHEHHQSPVRSLKQTLEEADQAYKYALPQYRHDDARNRSRRRSTVKPQIADDCGNGGSSQLGVNSQLPLTPPILPVPTSQEPSLPSSPKSLSSRSTTRSEDNSIRDEMESEAVASTDDEQEAEMTSEVQDSAPQLIMPSIRMPSRRPFTERGKQLGRFKILVAGTKGSGRTSLIKSIVQLCEDIVHVDSVTTVPKLQISKSGGDNSRLVYVNEIYASTKPYPFWWSDLDESRVLKRRKSIGDSVLERNLCFVDTVNTGKLDKVIHYLEQQLILSVNHMDQRGQDLTALLCGRGGTQVDVVLYLITKDTLKDDCNNIKRISQICNVVPLLSKADLLSSELVNELKALALPGITFPRLPFEPSHEHCAKAIAPYTVSSANGTDFDIMDASLLMSPEYVRPLIPSELSFLVQQLFEPNTVAYLRHTSSKKLVSWYATEPRLMQISSPSVKSQQASTLNSPLPTSLSNSGVLVPVTSELSLNTSNSYALAKVADHTQREEHLAQIRLSKWASDLQLSLQRERDRYESIAQAERAIWLVQRMGEELQNGQVVPLQNSQAMIKASGGARIVHHELRYETHDPLGLLRWQGTVRTRGWAALQIVGSFGVMGGVALWLAKAWGLTTSLQEWVQRWIADFLGTAE